MSDPINLAVYAIRDCDGYLLSLQDSYRAFNNWAVPFREANDFNLFKQLWLVEAVENSNPTTYKIRCLTNAAVLSVEQDSTYGDNINGTFLSGFSDAGGPYQSQQWTFENNGYGQFIIKNPWKGTALEMHQHNNNGWAGASNVTNSRNQYWTLERRSRANWEIENLLKNNNRVKFGDAFKHYAADGTYITLPDPVRQEIWEKSGLGYDKDMNARTYPWREQIFDCDDFSVVMKSEVAKWAAANLRTNHFSILIGICWGDKPDEKGVHAHHAFNWYLTQDLKGVTYYEPQTGLQKDDAMGYMIYYGNF